MLKESINFFQKIYTEAISKDFLPLRTCCQFISVWYLFSGMF